MCCTQVHLWCASVAAWGETSNSLSVGQFGSAPGKCGSFWKSLAFFWKACLLFKNIFLNYLMVFFDLSYFCFNNIVTQMHHLFRIIHRFVRYDVAGATTGAALQLPKRGDLPLICINNSAVIALEKKPARVQILMPGEIFNMLSAVAVSNITTTPVNVAVWHYICTKTNQLPA